MRAAGADPRGAHGILGQAFAPGRARAQGRGQARRLQRHGGDDERQAEGAIEGVYTEYKLVAPFDTAFKYSRFDDTTPAPAVAKAVPALSASAHYEADA